MPREARPKTKKLELTLDPTQGAARLMVSMAPEGYRFVSMRRKGTKAVAIYERIVDADPGSKG